MSKIKSRAHILVSGRVQGVFFRDFTKSNANSLGLTGWVRNLRGGCVEALAEGEKEDIEKLIQQLKVGPPAARVWEVKVEWEEWKGKFSDFRIRWF
ncbi:acylphosphatase [candidate division KSB1 bacterium]|nr:acylphosphatase [candidate division KSB1 bacterium]